MALLVRAFVLAACVLAALAPAARAVEAGEHLAPEAPEIKADPVPAALPKKVEAPPAPANDEATRDAQAPSPGGAGKPRALLIDRPDLQLAFRGFGQLTFAP